MLVYDVQLPVLDDKFVGDEVALLAAVGGRVDRNFRRNYAWAKHAADVGKLKKITVVVDVDSTDVVHTVGAVTSALSGRRLHGDAVFLVRAAARSFEVGVTAAAVEAGLAGLAAEAKPVEAPVKPEVKAEVKPEVEAKPEVKADVKPAAKGAAAKPAVKPVADSV